MTDERAVVRELAESLALGEHDATEIVESAWAEAREEVRQVLRGLMVRELLGRSAAVIAASTTGPAGPGTDRPHPPRTATYVFGVTDRDVHRPDAGAPAVPTAGPLRTVEHAGLHAVVCDVDPTAVGRLGDPRAGDLDVVAAAARAHDAVLVGVARSGPVLPLRFGTVLADDGSVTTLLRRHRDRLVAELERVRAHAEWAVTVDLPSSGDVHGARAATGNGRAYLESRRAALEARREHRTTRDAVVEHVHAELSEVAVDAGRIRRRAFDEDTPSVLHGVYLVADRDLGRFSSAVERLGATYPDAHIETTGPWPPYHFTDVDLSADVAAHR